jgi:hypothetical protein
MKPRIDRIYWTNYRSVNGLSVEQMSTLRAALENYFLDVKPETPAERELLELFQSWKSEAVK